MMDTNITGSSILTGILGQGICGTLAISATMGLYSMLVSIKTYCLGPWLVEKDCIGTFAFSDIVQILSGMAGTTCFVLTIVQSWLKINYTRRIWANCCIRERVTIPRTFKVVVVLSYMRVFKKLT